MSNFMGYHTDTTKKKPIDNKPFRPIKSQYELHKERTARGGILGIVWFIGLIVWLFATVASHIK